MDFELLILSGPESYFTGAARPAHGDTHSLPKNASTIVGRHPDASICIKDGAVARRHCAIAWDPVVGQFMIDDLESPCGTLVNGTAVTPGQLVSLNSGDKIQCGRTLFQLKACIRPT